MAQILYVTNILIDFGALAQLAAECERVGIRKPLIVTDAGVKAAGLLDKALAALPGLAPAVFDQTPSNPTEAAVRAAVEVYRKASCDGLIALGGGSAIDCAKGVAIASAHEGPLKNYATIEGGSPKITDRVPKGRLLTLQERLHVVFDASKEVRKATAFGEAIIITVYFPILALSGVEGKMFHPMALTVIFALIAAFILSLTFVPAMVALCIRGRVTEKDMFLVRWAKALYAPVVRVAVKLRYAVVGAAIAAFAGAVVLFGTLGQEFVPTLDEKDIAMHAMRIPSTGITQSQLMQYDVERTVAKFPEVAFTYSKTGTAELASDPMPPNVSDTFIILKPREEWRSEEELDRRIAELEAARPDEAAHEEDKPGHGEEAEGAVAAQGHKAKLIKLIELTDQSVPGNNY